MLYVTLTRLERTDSDHRRMTARGEFREHEADCSCSDRITSLGCSASAAPVVSCLLSSMKIHTNVSLREFRLRVSVLGGIRRMSFALVRRMSFALVQARGKLSSTGRW
jgi:hypothetical protein